MQRKKNKEVDDKYIKAISKYHIEHGYYPNMREIAELTGFSSVASVFARMKGLLAQGRIKTDKEGDVTAYRLVGHWLENDGFECSICGRKAKETAKFCPRCGSHMTLAMRPCSECINYMKTTCCCTVEERKRLYEVHETDCFQTVEDLINELPDNPIELTRDNLAEWIKAQRTNLGLTVEQMAEFVGIASTTFNSIERGKRVPKMGTFLAIIDACGFEMEVKRKAN